MQRFRLTGPYVVPAPLVIRLQQRHVDVVYPDPPSLCVSVGGSWQAARPYASTVGVAFAAVPPVEQLVGLQHGQARPVDDGVRDGWRRSGTRDALQGEAWRHAVARDAAALAEAWAKVPPRDSGQRAGWSWASPTDHNGYRVIWQLAHIADAGAGVRHRDTDLYGSEWRYSEQLPPYRPGTQPLRLRVNGVRYVARAVPPVYFQLGRDLRSRPTQPRDQSTGVRYGSSSAQDIYRDLPWNRARPTDAWPTGITYPDYNGPVIVIDPPVEPDILETYMIANSVSVVVLPEGTPLDVADLRLRLDIDSFSWAFSCSLLGATSMALVRPDADGPKTLLVTMNGWTWRVIVEKYSRTAQFPAERYSISGAGRTQYLAAPYAPLRSAVNALDINARQVMDDQLLNTGFTIEWDVDGLGPPDWTIPAGALTYQDQTPMQIIARVAESVGAVVRPSRDSDQLEILQRYRDPPWLWSETVVDRIIAGEVITDLSSEWSPQPKWNSVYVSGTTHGVAVDVRRAGTAGDQPAPDVFDDLITATPAARARGICELSKGGDQELVSVTIPLFPVGGSAPGLVLPAHLVEVREPVETWRGLCLGVEIAATGTGASRVSQVLSIERHHMEGT